GGRGAGPRAARRGASGGRRLLPLRPLQLRQGRRAGAVRGRRRGPGRGGKAAGAAAAKDYGDNRYHAPADEYDPATWKLDGTMEDLEAVYAVGRALADDEQWPNWYEGN